MTDCIFCKIIAGEIPASKVYEDEHVLAFLDISQVTPGHTLVVPKKHFRNMLEMDGAAVGQLFACIPNIARNIHLAPRYTEDDDLNVTFVAHEPDFPALAALAKKISKA